MFIRHRQGTSQCANMLRARSLARLGKAPSFGMTHSGGSCSHEPSLGMTHSFLPVSVRHPEVPRTLQRDEGSCVDLPQSLMFIHHRQGISQCANMLHAKSLARLEKTPSYGMTHSGGSTVTSRAWG